jgi:hypothetical protein
LASWENEGGHSPLAAHPNERLDWASFLARFYPHARSHDYESLAAYIEDAWCVPGTTGGGVDELAGKALNQLAELRVLLRLPAVRELVEPVVSARMSVSSGLRSRSA